MTVQAKRLVDALTALGLKHGSWRTGGDFTVSTDVKRIRSRTTGERYSEYDDAIRRLEMANVTRFRAPSGNSDSDRFFAKCSACGWKGAYHSNRTVEGRKLAERDALAHRCDKTAAVRER